MSLPRMSLHIGDYRKDTGHLRAALHGAYLLLIMHYWATGGLPADDYQLASIACMSDAEWRRAKPIIQGFFGPDWKHKRIETEIAAATAKYQKRVAAGKKGGQQKSSNATAKAKQPITLTNSKSEDGGGGARAREAVPGSSSLISNEAMALADDLAVVAGHDPKFVPPAWCGAPMRVQMWLDRGWTREVILIAAKGAMSAKRDGSPSTVNYFEKPISRMVAQQSIPIATVEALNGAPAIRPAKQAGWQQRRDDWFDALGELGEHNAANG
jgi:uncharacterized protein YdaU (DUF1376 family)